MTLVETQKVVSLERFKKICETEFDWNKIFGAVKDVYSDKGFKSNADNFIRARILELSIVCFSQIIHIDQDGVDFLLIVDGEDVLIECKFLKGFFKKDGSCKDIKMKNYRGDVSEETYNRFKTENKFDYLMIVDKDKYQVAISSKETAQKYYYSKGDGVFTNIPTNELNILNLNVSNFTFPSSEVKLSEMLHETMVNWIKNR